MPDVMRAYCPIDGLLLGAKNVNNALANSMKNKGNRAHAVWDIVGSLTCSNGHQWSADGRIEMRWDLADTDFTTVL